MPRLIPLVDDADYAWAMQWRWSYMNGYAQRASRVDGCRVARTLHRALIDPLPGLFVDHINRNPRDNRRCNLRAVTPSENVRNSSKGSHDRLVHALLTLGECHYWAMHGRPYEECKYNYWRFKVTGNEVSTAEMSRRIERHYVDQLMCFVAPEHRLDLPDWLVSPAER